ncbi:MAG: prepilin-type N-terminal cleavage/methylation domain-containing protein [Candidatus Hydrogenedentes bacterium]|nr:prepilin-type N-terminal cleavage/methylation domain-containing protein [Candidatus Hydrogenedentota bacterium]
MTNSRIRRGFTLLELLVVMAVLSVVTTIGVRAFGNMVTLWGDTSASMELDANCASIFGTMRQDLERVASAQRTGRSIQGVDRLETEQLVNRYKPEDDSIVLPIRQRNLGTGPWEELAVRYHINRDGGALGLMRTIGPNDGTTPAGATQLIGEKVVAMNIVYLSHDNTWEKEWSRSELPAAVRVSLTVSLPDRPFEQISREALFPIHVK